MRVFVALIAYMIALAPASALDASDAMRAWARAQTGDKDRLLDEMFGSTANAFSKSPVRTCLDEAAKLTAHEDLSIAEVFKACAAQASGEKV
jgi:hypothetical protein